jgi:hypothetical protein
MRAVLFLAMPECSEGAFLVSMVVTWVIISR